jgi:uncharacterized protein
MRSLAAGLLLLCAPAAAGPGLAAPHRAVLLLPDSSKIDAELAITPQAQERGLMYREKLGDDEGMLFVFREDAPRTFWMKNTYVSLDIVFLDADMKVRNIFHRVPRSYPDTPESEVARVSAPAMYVLELAAGRARKAGLRPGSVIKKPAPLPGKGKKGGGRGPGR